MPADVLIVDDDPGIRMLLADMLAFEGYAVRLAVDGVEALDACADAFPSLMILDLAMPRLDGYGVVSELVRRDWRRHFPVFVVTARSGACDELRAASLIDECVQKPFDVGEVLAKISELIPAPSQ